jgi:hypothetical protein
MSVAVGSIPLCYVILCGIRPLINPFSAQGSLKISTRLFREFKNVTGKHEHRRHFGFGSTISGFELLIYKPSGPCDGLMLFQYDYQFNQKCVAWRGEKYIQNIGSKNQYGQNHFGDLGLDGIILKARPVTTISVISWPEDLMGVL